MTHIHGTEVMLTPISRECCCIHNSIPTHLLTYSPSDRAHLLHTAPCRSTWVMGMHSCKTVLRGCSPAITVKLSKLSLIHQLILYIGTVSVRLCVQIRIAVTTGTAMECGRGLRPTLVFPTTSSKSPAGSSLMHVTVCVHHTGCCMYSTSLCTSTYVHACIM